MPPSAAVPPGSHGTDFLYCFWTRVRVHAGVALVKCLTRRPLGTHAGEDYICDWVAFCMPPPGKLDMSGGAGVRGRLRLCSLSLVFDPDDQRLPILKLPFAKVEQLDKDDGVEGALSVTSTQWLRMRASGVDSPYVNDKSGPATWRFSLAFAKLSALLVRAHRCSADCAHSRACCCPALTVLSTSPGPGQAAAGHLPPASLRAPGRAQGGCPGAGGCGHVRRLPPDGPIGPPPPQRACRPSDAPAARARAPGGHPRPAVLPAVAQPECGHPRPQQAAVSHRGSRAAAPPAAPRGPGGVLHGARRQGLRRLGGAALHAQQLNRTDAHHAASQQGASIFLTFHTQAARDEALTVLKCVRCGVCRCSQPRH